MSLSAAQQAARLLAERPEHDWRLDELAALVHLSVSQLGPGPRQSPSFSVLARGFVRVG